MEIQYVIINFLILAAILVIFGRKTAISIFKNRYDKLNRELDEAEEILSSSAPDLPEEDFTLPEISEDFEVESARAAAESKL